jgi:hypothetical protein
MARLLLRQQVRFSIFGASRILPDWLRYMWRLL